MWMATINLVQNNFMITPRLKTGLWITGITVAILTVAVVTIAVQTSRHGREWMVDSLQQEFKCEVELTDLHISVFPHIHIEGKGLSLHFHGRTDLPPMINVDRFSVDASYLGLLLYPHHIDTVHLQGLQINIPPKGERRSEEKASARRSIRNLHAVYFDEVISENAVLKILTTKPGKAPLEFKIEKVQMHSLGSDGELAFHSVLSIPTPPGQIDSSGTFGPWNADVPSLTPVSGQYTFENVDMGVFRGIRGTLSSKGEYQGAFEQIQVHGTTDIPNFQVDRAAHPIHISTTFKATVDGTNGDTDLHSVQAHFGHTDMTAQGSVEGHAGTNGKTVKLSVVMGHARIEDILLFAVKEPPPMTGSVGLRTEFFLAPGPQDISDRLRLNGTITLENGHFTSTTEQQMLDNMSKRGLGKPKEVQARGVVVSNDDIASTLGSKFQLDNGILTLSGLWYRIPGIDLQLHGTYNLGQETLDLHGQLAMQAKLSQTTTGVKSIFLKAADPFFSKDGKGAVIPIKITGLLKNPKYGIE